MPFIPRRDVKSRFVVPEKCFPVLDLADYRVGRYICHRLPFQFSDDIYCLARWLASGIQEMPVPDELEHQRRIGRCASRA